MPSEGVLEEFETVTLRDVRAGRATVVPTGTGEEQVSLTVGAKRRGPTTSRAQRARSSHTTDDLGTPTMEIVCRAS